MDKLEVIPPDCIKGCLIHPGPDQRGYEVTQEAMLEIVKTKPKDSFGCFIPVFLGDKTPASLPVGKIIDFDIKEGALYTTIKIGKNYTDIVERIKNNGLNMLGFSGYCRKITKIMNSENIELRGPLYHPHQVEELRLNYVCIKQDKYGWIKQNKEEN